MDLLTRQLAAEGIAADAKARLDYVVSMMRELSLQTDPQAMVRLYGQRLRKLMPADRSIGFSRRGLSWPQYRITRFSGWTEEVNPWSQTGRLPLHSGGILAELIYGDEPRIIDDLRVAPDDPAAPYLEGMRSLMALPNYDAGVALNVTAVLSPEPGFFDAEILADRVWMSNLFGRATSSLVTKAELERAMEVVDREMRAVANMQRALLPRALPEIPRLSLAAHYETSNWAGGDYYDVFPLPDGRWGLLIADVSGHGTPAAVMMAIVHALSHSYPGPAFPPTAFLEYLNRRLCERYTAEGEAFVTAFYGIFDPQTLRLHYACAGHNPPRLKRCADGTIASLDRAHGLPLGVFAESPYTESMHQMRRGDQLILYTDGVTEATNPEGRMFGMGQLDVALQHCHEDAHELIASVLATLEVFTAGAPPEDDRTLLVAKVG
jgi:sigma-B regulation protein RsbU (phosphoserine phosphatase)